jgi:methylated-DNA-[protein]-cysteine S-methyltransferase
MMNSWTSIETVLGELVLAGDGEAVAAVTFADTLTTDPGRRVPGAYAGVAEQLRAYLAGDRLDVTGLRQPAGTPFQRRVWEAVDAVPYGDTASYGELAARIGAGRDRIRAVAAAVGANPLLVWRPCHRIVGARGALTGYAGGLWRKRELLTLEGALPPQLALTGPAWGRG